MESGACGADPRRARSRGDQARREAPALCGADANARRGPHRPKIPAVPLDPVARKLLDEVAASGRPNAHLLPVAEARVNFESLFAGLGAGEAVASVADHSIAVDGGAIPARSYRPAGASAGEKLGRSSSTSTAAAGCSAPSAPTTGSAARSQTPRVRSSSTPATASRRRPASRPPSTMRSPRPAGRTRTLRCSVPTRAASRSPATRPAATLQRSSARTCATPRSRSCASSCSSIRSRPPISRIGFDMAYEGYFLYRDELLWHQEHYLSSPADAPSPRVSPLSATPRACRRQRSAAECDPLHPQAERYRDLLAAAGVAVAYAPTPA